MRHISRTHGVQSSWLAEVFKKAFMRLQHAESDLMAADVYTKAFKEVAKLVHACRLTGSLSPKYPLDQFVTQNRKTDMSDCVVVCCVPV